MKKIVAIVLSIIMMLGVVCSLASCNNVNAELVAVDAVDLIKEDFGIAIKKGNSSLKDMVNEVVDAWVADGTMAKYLDYYAALANGETPDANGLKTSWDFGNATEVLTVYTESGFAPFEFVMNREVIGVDIAIMSEVAERNNMKVVVKDVAFDTITTCVKDN
jgi:ABC-type amino acid transport substrate-binding protein